MIIAWLNINFSLAAQIFIIVFRFWDIMYQKEKDMPEIYQGFNDRIKAFLVIS